MKQPALLDHSLAFPQSDTALESPDGLLAVGGDLRPQRLRAAYRAGIFPYYDADPPTSNILWWSPSSRAVLLPQGLHVSRSLKRGLKKQDFRVTLDQAFARVITRCAQRESTWITPNMQAAYIELHEEGTAHSVEVWREGELIGGLYGVNMGLVFFAESMFSAQTNGSKIAMVYLAAQLHRWRFGLIDCQFQTDHLQRMGVMEVPRTVFMRYLDAYASQPGPIGKWRLHPDLDLG